MTISDLYAVLDARFPRELSCEWDNDGIMCCADRDREVKKVLVSLDATLEAILEASKRGCDLLLTHHPMIFKPLRCVDDDVFPSRRVIEAITNMVSVISLHTRLDAADDGVNDRLVETLGYRAEGKFGSPDAPRLGRYFDLDEPTDAERFAAFCKERLASPFVRVTGSGKVRRVCVVGGSGSDLISSAREIGADLLLTGECSYNAAQDSAETGLIIIEAGHFETEAPVCKALAAVCCELGIENEYFDSRSFTVV